MFRKTLLFLIVLLLPTQLGLHFWPEFSYVSGFRVDFLSPTLYLLDCLIILYLGSSIGKIASSLRHSRYIFNLLVIFLLNLLFSISPLNTLSWWLHLLEYYLLYLVFREDRLKFSDVALPLTVSTTIILTLELFQFARQSSLDGLWYWLGERHLSLSSVNIARLQILGKEFLRPYSTFSHPNSLAGYLLVAYFIFQTKSPSRLLKIFIALGILFTFSKSAIVGLVILQVPKLRNIKNTNILIVLCLLPLLGNNFSNNLPKFIDTRQVLGENALTLIKQFPLFGVGLGNQITASFGQLETNSQTPFYLQPIHSVPLLLIIELGLLPLTFIIYHLRRHQVRLSSEKLALINLVLITGAFDHYWWTLPQNKLILVLAAVLIV